MSGVATAVAGGAVLSSVIGANAASGAANTEANAANAATQAQLQMFNTQQANEKPYLEAGYGALSDIQKQMPTFNQPFTMSQFQQDPGYQFELAQGQKAIDASSSAKSGLLSGNEQAASANYVQGLAGTEFNNAFNRYQTQQTNSFNRLSSLAGLGQTGVQTANQGAMNAGNNIGQNMIGAGNAAAAGQVGVANAINNGIGMGVNGITNYAMLSKLFPQKPQSLDNGNLE